MPAPATSATGSASAAAARKITTLISNPFWVFEALVAIELPIKWVLPLPIIGMWPLIYFGIERIKRGMGWVFDQGTGLALIVELLFIVVMTLLTTALGRAAQGGSKPRMGFLEALIIWPPIVAPLILDLGWAVMFVLIFTVVAAVIVAVFTRDVPTAVTMAPPLPVFTAIIWVAIWLGAITTNWAGSGEFYLWNINILQKNQQINDADNVKLRQQLCQQGKTEYCGTQKPVFPQELLPGMNAANAEDLLAQYCRTKTLPAGLPQGLIQPQFQGYLDTFCQQWQGYQGAPTVPGIAAPPGTGAPAGSTLSQKEVESLASYYCATGSLPSGWQNISEADKVVVNAAAKKICPSGPNRATSVPAPEGSTSPSATGVSPTAAPTAPACPNGQVWTGKRCVGTK